MSKSREFRGAQGRVRTEEALRSAMCEYGRLSRRHVCSFVRSKASCSCCRWMELYKRIRPDLGRSNHEPFVMLFTAQHVSVAAFSNGSAVRDPAGAFSCGYLDMPC